MKESTELLGITSSGIRELTSTLPDLKDNELFNEAIKISNENEKENFLREKLKSKPDGYLKSSGLLIKSIKKTDPKYSCELILTLAQNAPINPEVYLLLAEIALENNAVSLTENLINTAKWLAYKSFESSLNNVLEFEKIYLEKKKQNVEDVSKNDFWINKTTDKYWILERLYYRSNTNIVADYAFKLLNDFPNEISNYDAVFRVFSIDNKTTKDFVEYIKNKNNINEEFKHLYLGLSYYNLLDIEKSILNLNKTLEINPKNKKALLYLALNYLLKNDLSGFFQIFKKITPDADPINVSLYFIYSIFTKAKLDKKEFPNQKNISKEILNILSKMLQLGFTKNVEFLTQEFANDDFSIILPDLLSFIIEMYIKNNEIEKAKKLIEGCKSIEVLRLSAWINRIEGNEKEAEILLTKYRKEWMAPKDTGIYCKLISLDLPSNIPESIEEILSFLKSAYSQTKNLIDSFHKKYALDSMTCIDAQCQDCCIYTYPYITYIEYLNIRLWLNKQDVDFQNKILENSKKILTLYKEKYNKEAPFLDKDKPAIEGVSYPRDFIFHCPFLGDNKCDVYHERPFTCRAYGFGSSENALYKGCNYFFEQYKSATKLTSIREVINMKSFIEFAQAVDFKLIGKKVVAPIPVWFSQNHEETLKKLLT